MNPYLLIGTAIPSELVGTTALKLSNGFSRPLPTLGVVVFNEHVDPIGVVGILLITAGAYCLLGSTDRPRVYERLITGCKLPTHTE